MGIWDRLFGRRRPEELTPDALRDQLFDAVTDEARFVALCKDHEAAILRHFADWKVVPQELREDRAAVNHWGRGLIAIAQLFAQQGNAGLLELLRGPAGKNPLELWGDRLSEAKAFIDEQRFAEAIAVLLGCLEQAKGLSGPGKDHYLALTHGGLGHGLFHRGDVKQAEPHVAAALRLCQESDAESDREGVPIYLTRLYEIRRYLGDAVGAAELAERLGREPGSERERWQRQAAIVRSGEPLNRVVVRIGEKTFELDDLPHVNGAVKFEFRRNRDGILLAEDLLTLGSQYASNGELEQALSNFQQAAKIDPFHPEPPYLAGLTLIHLRRYQEAVASYEKTEELAPGWFHCRADLALARALHAGRIDQETFRSVERIDGESNPEACLQQAEAALLRAPDLAILHLQKGRALGQLKRSDAARAALERGLATAEDVDVRTRLLVELANCTRDPLQRTQYLEDAIALSGNLVAAAMAKVMLRAAPEA
jgi:tetratricopeptide (TPR) repeat protein